MTARTMGFIAVVMVSVLAWASWMFRYQALNPTEDRPGLPPILDRWTGEALFNGEWWPVHDIEAKEEEIAARTRTHDTDMPAAPQPSM